MKCVATGGGLRGKPSVEGQSRSIRLSGARLGARAHICTFSNNADDEYRVLLPLVTEDPQFGEKAFHTVDPRRRDDHLRRLAVAGIDVTTTRGNGQLEGRDWRDMHLRDSHLDRRKTLARFQAVVKDAKQQGFPITRFVTHTQRAVESSAGADELRQIATGRQIAASIAHEISQVSQVERRRSLDTFISRARRDQASRRWKNVQVSQSAG